MVNTVVRAVFLCDDFWDQLTSTLTAATTIGEIEPVSINGLVNETKAKVGSSRMDRLEIFCHGTDTYIQAGTDTLHTYSPKAQMPKLARLKGLFAKDAIVVMYVCKAGKCTSVLTEMAKTLGVEIYATTGDVRPLAYGTPFVISGGLVVARPNGTTATGNDVENVYYYDETQD